MDLFERASPEQEYILYKKYVVNFLNDNNLLSTSTRRIKLLFQIGTEKHYLRYRFELLRRWIKWNLRYTNDSIKTLDSILKKLNIIDNLNPNEVDFIYSVRNIIFAKKRNLKSVLTDLTLDKKEYAYYIYKINHYLENNILKEAKVILLTSKRIIIEITANNFISIPYDTLTDYHVYSNYLGLKTLNKAFNVYCAEPKLLYVSLERIFQLTKGLWKKYE